MTPKDLSGLQREVFQWKCREPGCGAVHLVYKEHIEHLVTVHGLLTKEIHVKAIAAERGNNAKEKV